jgi:hypothetical protein
MIKKTLNTKSITKVKRICLKCTNLFSSSSKLNRVCENCKKANKRLSVRAEGILDL